MSGKDPIKVAAIYGALRQAYDTGGQQAYFRKWVELIHADQALPLDERMLDFDNGELACYYAQLGEKEKALDLLEKHFDQPQLWHQIKFMSPLDPLHDEPRFKALVKRAGFEE